MSTKSSAHPAPSLWFTGVLGALLCIPFAIKLMIAEPYPAVIMPSGSGRIDISQGTYQFNNYRAYGITESGAQEPLDLMKLIQPAHSQYLYGIFEHHFGLKSDPRKTIKLRGTDWTIASYRLPGATPEHQIEWRTELKARLGHRFEQLLLEQVSVVGDLKTRNWIQETHDESILIEL